MACFPTSPLFDAPAQGKPLEFLDKTYPTKTKGLWLPYYENCIILTKLFLDRSARVTDRQT